MDFDLSFFKKHPSILIAVGLVGAYVFYEIALAPSGAALPVGAPPIAQQTTDTPGGQMTQLGYQAAAQQSAQDYQLAADAQKSAFDKYIADLNASTSTTQQVNAIQGTVAVDTINANSAIHINDVNTAAVITQNANNNSTQITLQNNNNITQEHLATTSANLQTTIAQIGAATSLAYANIVSNAGIQVAGINAATTVTLADFTHQDTIANIDASRDISIAAINANKKSGSSSFLAGFFTALL